MLSREDLATICAELGAALTRIGERLAAPSAGEQIVQGMSEAVEHAKGEAETRVTVVEQPRNPSQAERILALAAERDYFTSPEAADALGIKRQSCHAVMCGLVRDGKIECDDAFPRRHWLPGKPKPAPLPPKPSEEPSAKPRGRSKDSLPSKILALAGEGPFTVAAALERFDVLEGTFRGAISRLLTDGALVASDGLPTVYALPGTLPQLPGHVGAPVKPLLREKLLALAAEGPFTSGRALARIGCPESQFYTVARELVLEGALLRCGYPHTYSLPASASAKPIEPPAPARKRLAAGERPCLRCSKPFPSEGPHNRLCPPCASAASASAVHEPYDTGRRV